MRIMSENEIYDFQRNLLKINKRIQMADSIKQCVKVMICTPISISLNVISAILKIAGSILAVGLPFGIYFLYKIIVQLHNGIPFAEVSDKTFTLLFFIFPFTAFFFHYITKKLSEILYAMI